MNKLLVVVAHPDDETFGLGSVIAHAASHGVEVAVACATRGELGEVAPGSGIERAELGDVREAELRAAVHELGGSRVEMLGWLDTWGLVRNSNDKMAWMAGHAHVSANGLMPGMATPAQLEKLLSLRGKAMDVLFLQLMIHHHQGGVVMAQYAAEHAQESYVRNTAQSMYLAQSNEIVQMEQLLRQLGGEPLPPPAN